jgi:hypothetical protein
MYTAFKKSHGQLDSAIQGNTEPQLRGVFKNKIGLALIQFSSF